MASCPVMTEGEHKDVPACLFDLDTAHARMCSYMAMHERVGTKEPLYHLEYRARLLEHEVRSVLLDVGVNATRLAGLHEKFVELAGASAREESIPDAVRVGRELALGMTRHGDICPLCVALVHFVVAQLMVWSGKETGEEREAAASLARDAFDSAGGGDACREAFWLVLFRAGRFEELAGLMGGDEGRRSDMFVLNYPKALVLAGRGDQALEFIECNTQETMFPHKDRARIAFARLRASAHFVAGRKDEAREIVRETFRLFDRADETYRCCPERAEAMHRWAEAIAGDDPSAPDIVYKPRDWFIL